MCSLLSTSFVGRMSAIKAISGRSTMPDEALRSSEALMRRSAAIVSAMMLLAMITLLSSCGSGQTAAAECTASATPSTSPTPVLGSQQLRRVVHAYALKIGAEEGRAPCQASSNPYDYCLLYTSD